MIRTKYALQIRTDQGPVYEHPLRGRTLAIGRLPDNDVVLDHDAVSDHHLRIEQAPRDADAPFILMDLDSQHGTHCRGQRLPAQTPVAIQLEELVRVGPYTLRLAQNRPKSADTLPLMGDPVSASPSRPSNRLLWLMTTAALALALISLLINVVLALKLSQVARVGGEIATEMEAVFAQTLAEGITLEIDISQTIPISVNVPIDEEFSVQVQHDVSINEVVQAAVTIPVINRAVNIDIPVHATIPLDEVVTVRVQETVGFNEEIPVEMTVPIHLDPEALGLEPTMEKIQDWLARLRDVL
ncbi:MAG TPA: FHA domain-containing protein [Chloroflexi bacterium]|nr:FHA domain-containing protein [Chloroflexota bacterium]